MAQGDWLKERTTHAYALLGLGVGLIFGTPALASWLYPHSTPWWVPGAFTLGILGIIFGVLMLAAPGLVKLAGPYMPAPVINEAPAPPPPKPPEPEPPDPLVTWLEQQMLYLDMFDHRIPLYDDLGADNDPMRDLYKWSDRVGERLDEEGHEELREQLDSQPGTKWSQETWDHAILGHYKKMLRGIIDYLKNDAEEVEQRRLGEEREEEDADNDDSDDSHRGQNRPRGRVNRVSTDAVAYAVPVAAGEDITIEGRFPLSEIEWSQFMAVLTAMKPALVADRPELDPEEDDPQLA